MLTEEHEPFIAAIEAQPGDHTTRLVYADWLDDRDHPAGEYLRTELRLAELPEGSPAAPELRAQLRALRPRIEAEWLARFDQPRVMLANPTPFPAAWWGIELPSVRDFDATYHRFPYDTLPPLHRPPFTGAFDWLLEGQARPASPVWPASYAEHFRRLTQHLSDLGLTVPPDFTRWMTDEALWCVPSCTGCGPAPSWDTAAVDGPAGTRVLPFYIDSQACLTWYLYLTPDGYSAVVGGSSFLCNDWYFTARDNPGAPLDNSTPPEEPVVLAFVAPSVEAFLYRWCVENNLWPKLIEPRFRPGGVAPPPITPEEQAYIDFYRQHPVAGT